MSSEDAWSIAPSVLHGSLPCWRASGSGGGGGWPSGRRGDYIHVHVVTVEKHYVTCVYVNCACDAQVFLPQELKEKKDNVMVQSIRKRPVYGELLKKSEVSARLHFSV